MSSRATRKRIAASALAVALLAGSPQRAHAEIPPSFAAVYGLGAAIVVTDLVFTGYDIVKAASDERASTGMATAEVLVAAPQLVVGGLFLANQGELSGNSTAYLLWMGALTAHGAVTLMLPTAPPEPPSSSPNATVPTRAKPAAIAVVPSALADGDRSALVPAIVAVGRF